MAIEYKRADLNDLEALVSSRIKVLIAANKLPEDTDMSLIEQQSRDYYKKSLADGTHTAYLVYDGEDIIAAGGVSYYRVMPTCDVPTGRKAYIMNMYTDPRYRRQGIAYKTLSLLIKDAKSKGVDFISLEATDMGRPLYEKFGFVGTPHEMILPAE
ncbi:GNAT family N-acetyltransferase [Ruminococcus albus]|uniref:Acetyltransferase (GNAT) family protein n=1 Tax=Ruminococcus albus TaxID=1264 RepID=A0A1I1G8E1_RUMAL|nr:GNAT family N-acetyltransferase [Ruminococcus albus]SFC07989.1 Acetyltransferase (GNAT) family protein [Ruminococcus albus]